MRIASVSRRPPFVPIHPGADEPADSGRAQRSPASLLRSTLRRQIESPRLGTNAAARLAPWKEMAVLSHIWRFIVAGYNETAVKIVLGSSQGTLDWLAELRARGDLHLKGRSFARRRHHPDAAAVHLDDLLGDGEAEARAALGLGK